MKKIKDYLKEIFNFEGGVFILSAVVLTTIITLSTVLESLWPDEISVFGLQIPGFRIFAWMLNQIILLLIIPVIFLISFKKKPRDFGFRFKEIKKVWIFILIAFIGIIAVTFITSGNPEFQKVYPMYRYARDNISLLIIYEIVFLIYLFSWEFFFRGFLLFSLEKKFGAYAVLIQMIPFVIMHYAKPPLEIYSSILGGIILGILALKTRSFYPCWMLHLFFSIPMDIFVVLRS